MPKNYSTSTCSGCAMRFMFIAGSIIGFFPYRRKCLHGDKNQTTIFETSAILVALSYIYPAVLLLATCYEFYCNFNAEISLWKVENINTIGLFGLGLSGSVSFIALNLRHKNLEDGLNIFARLSSPFSAATDSEILSELNLLHRKSLIYVSISILTAIISAVVHYQSTKSITSLIMAFKMYNYCIGTYSIALLIDGFVTKLDRFSDNFKGILAVATEDYSFSRRNHVDTRNALEHLMKLLSMVQRAMRIVEVSASPSITIFLGTLIPVIFTSFYVGVIHTIHLVSEKEYSIYQLMWPLIFVHMHYGCRNIDILRNKVKIFSKNMVTLINFYFKCHMSFARNTLLNVTGMI